MDVRTQKLFISTASMAHQFFGAEFTFDNILMELFE